jgi:hypothetical protein
MKFTMPIPDLNGTYEALQDQLRTHCQRCILQRRAPRRAYANNERSSPDRYAVYGMIMGEATNNENRPMKKVFETFLDGWISIAENTVEACTTPSVNIVGATTASTCFTPTTDNSLQSVPPSSQEVNGDDDGQTISWRTYEALIS